MPVQECIKVEVLVNDQALTEYLHPDGEVERDHQITRFVEVKAGQRFAVKVTLLPGFEFFNASHVYIKFYADQEQSFRFWYCSCVDPGMFRGEVQQAREFLFDHCVIRDDRTGQFVKSHYEFGALGIEADASLPVDLSASDINLLGSLRASVYRATAKRRRFPEVWDGDVAKPLDEIPEKALKGKEIQNNVKYVVNGPAPRPKPQLYEYIPIMGKKGVPYEFKFLYRNRKTLQSIGCIPGSPSPSPIVSSVLRRNRRTISAMEQQIRDLQETYAQASASLARPPSSLTSSLPDLDSRASTLRSSRDGSVKNDSLEDSTTTFGQAGIIKMEPGFSTSPSPFSMAMKKANDLLPNGNNAGSGAGAKRQREEDELDEGELIEIAPPPRKPKIFVDLTLD